MERKDPLVRQSLFVQLLLLDILKFDEGLLQKFAAAPLIVYCRLLFMAYIYSFDLHIRTTTNAPTDTASPASSDHMIAPAVDESIPFSSLPTDAGRVIIVAAGFVASVAVGPVVGVVSGWISTLGY